MEGLLVLRASLSFTRNPLPPTSPPRRPQRHPELPHVPRRNDSHKTYTNWLAERRQNNVPKKAGRPRIGKPDHPLGRGDPAVGHTQIVREFKKLGVSVSQQIVCEVINNRGVMAIWKGRGLRATCWLSGPQVLRLVGSIWWLASNPVRSLSRAQDSLLHG